MSLIVSDANPLHFVDTVEETFNEKEYANVGHECFNDTWKCTSEIRTRIVNDEVKSYVIRFLNTRSGAQVGVDIPFDVVPIVDTNVSQPGNNIFDAVLDPWEVVETIGLGDANWAWSANLGGCARATLTTPSFFGDADKTKDLKIDYSLAAGKTYTFKVTGVLGRAADQRVRLYLRNSATAYNTYAEYTGGNAFEIELEVTPTEDCNELIITGENLTDDGNSYIEVSEVELLGLSYGGIHDAAFTPQVVGLCGLPISVLIVDVTDEENEVVVKVTDTLNFDEDTNWTLIQYKAQSNFAGMAYDEDSPYFQFYLPVQFFRERGKMEVVVAELSGGIRLNTGSSMVKDRKMIIDMVPDYKHNKFLLILQHAVNGTLLIDGYEWVVGDGSGYEYTEPQEATYPLQGAEIFLAWKNYSTRNII